MSARTLTVIRNGSFSLLGVVLLIYAIGVLLSGTPAFISPWLPAAAGVVTAAVVTLAAMAAGGSAKAVAWDELAREEWRACLRLGFWVAVWLYPVFAVLHYGMGVVDADQSFAAMGTLTAAAPFLRFLAKWLAGRV